MSCYWNPGAILWTIRNSSGFRVVEKTRFTIVTRIIDPIRTVSPKLKDGFLSFCVETIGAKVVYWTGKLGLSLINKNSKSKLAKFILGGFGYPIFNFSQFLFKTLFFFGARRIHRLQGNYVGLQWDYSTKEFLNLFPNSLVFNFIKTLFDKWSSRTDDG